MGQSYYLTHHTTHGWTATPLPLVKKEPCDLDQSGPDGGGSPMSSPTPHSSPDHTRAAAASTSPAIRPMSSSSSSSSTSPSTYKTSPRRAALPDTTTIAPASSSGSGGSGSGSGGRSDIKSCFQCGRVHSPCWRRGPNRTMLCNSCGLKHARKLRKGRDEEETNDREPVVVVGGPPGRASDQTHSPTTTTTTSTTANISSSSNSNHYTKVPKATCVPGHDQGHGHSFVAPHGTLFPLMSLFPPPISSATTASPPSSSSQLAWPSPLLASLSPSQSLGLSHSSTLANAASSLLHLATGGPPSTSAAAAAANSSTSSPLSSISTTTTTSNATTTPHHHLPSSPLPELYAALTSAATPGPAGPTSPANTLADHLALLFTHNTAAYLSLLASVPQAALPSPPVPVPATTEVNSAAGLQQLILMLQHYLQPPLTLPPPPAPAQQQQHQKHHQQHSELQQRLRQLQLQLQLPTPLPAALVHQPPPSQPPHPTVVPVAPPTLTLPPLSSLCDIIRSLPPHPQPPPQLQLQPPPRLQHAPRAPHQAKFVALQAALRSSVPGLQYPQHGFHRPTPSSAALPASSSPSPPLSSSASPFTSSSLTPSSLTMKCSSPSSPSSSSSSPLAAAAAFKLGRGKRKMKTYTCRTCLLPKKGHICPAPLADSSSPASSPPSSPRPADSIATEATTTSPPPAKKRRRNKTAPPPPPPEAKERGARAAANSSSSMPTVTFVSRAFSWSSREPKAS